MEKQKNRVKLILFDLDGTLVRINVDYDRLRER